MAASLRSDSPAATARSSSPAAHARMPTEYEIEERIQQATAAARAANGGRSPVLGRDTRTQLFVGNLPYRVRWQDLKDLFRKAGGTVLRADVSLGPDNRSRGYGTVLLASAEDAGRAIDMFNGYVWQTRTLEVRPDRLPNDFDMGIASNNLPPLNKMASPQLMQFTASMNMPAASSMHPLSMSTTSNSSLQPTLMAPSLTMPAATSSIPQSLPMNAAGLGAPQMDSSLSAYSTETVRPNGLDGTDITRSTSAFKALPPTMSSSTAPSGVSADVLDYSQMGGKSNFGTHAVNDYSSNRSDSPDYQGRKVYVSNVSMQYSVQDLQHMFQAAGTLVKLNVSPGGMDGARNATLIYYSKEEAQAAIERFDGLELNGRILRLQIANGDLPLSQSNGSQNEDHFNPQSPTAMTASTGTNGVTNATADPYRYSYMMMNTMGSMGSMGSMGPMGGAPIGAGYPLASPPQSPYDPYPPSLGYPVPVMPAMPSPSSAYPPPMPSGVGVYYSWHHRPPSPTPSGPSGTGTASTQLPSSTNANINHNPTSSSSAAGLSTTATNTTAVPSASMGTGAVNGVGGAASASAVGMSKGNTTTNGNSGSSTGSRVGPGPISLPGPVNAYPPAPISPIHGLPPITPSMPSFTFMPQPLPTPPLHPQFLSPGLAAGPYSPPGFYRPAMNPYFNLSPGAPVHYHHDANAIASNGAIGSGAPGAVGPPGVNGMGNMSNMGNMNNIGNMGNMANGTPYFDRTVATAGSDVPQEYFPPMPITNSISGALAAMSLNSVSSSGPLGPIAESEPSQAQSQAHAQAQAMMMKNEEAAPFLEPVGVGSDGFPSLSADPTSVKKNTPGSAGLSDWVVSPDDMPLQSQSESHSSTTANSVVHTTTSSPGPNSAAASGGGFKMAGVKTYSPPRRNGTSLMATPLNERAVSANPTPTTSNSPSKVSSATFTKSGSPTSPKSPKAAAATGSPTKGAIYSSSNKPKLTLGPMFPRPFNPPGNTVDAGAGAGPIPGVNVVRSPEMVSGGGGSETSALVAALKINGTPNGFRDSLGVDPEAGGMRRASWTEDASRRQSIVAGLANTGDPYGRHM